MPITPEQRKAALLDTALHAPRALADIEREALASRPGMRIIPTATARIRARVAEAAGRATLVLLPDGPNIIEHYDPIFARYEGRLTIIALEIPGFGFSYATDPAALTFEGCVEACADAIEALGYDRLILTGPCVQAYVAIALAAHFSERVLGVIAMQATDIGGERRWMERAIDPKGVLRTPVAGQRYWSDPAVREAQAVEGWYRAAAAPGFAVEPWQRVARWAIRAGCSNALPTLCQTWLANDEALAELPIYQGPSHILFGGADRTHLASGSDPEGLRAYLPKARTHLLVQAGHFPDLEAQDYFIQLVDEIGG